MSHTVHGKWIGVNGATCFAILAISYVILSFRRKRDNDENCSPDDEQESRQKSDEKEDECSGGLKFDALPYKRFPWEGKDLISSKNEDVLNKQCQETTQQQLKFISSMTFASTGLRKPSCPCCM